MRRGSIVQLVVIGLVAGAIAAGIALAVPWMPTIASEEAERIDFVYWFATVISLFVFAVVAAILIYALINFRVEDPNDWSDGPPIHGNTTLEVVWTVIPTILVTAISIVSAVALAQNGNASNDRLKIGVIAQQFAWQFKYPDGQVYPVLRVPLDRQIELNITANDVIHSFWVPQWAQKQDAVPGAPQHILVTPTKLGTFPVVCTELCGLGHSIMRSQAIVMTQAEYDDWYEKGAAPSGGGSGGGGAAAGGEAIFTENGCGACHTFSAVPSAQGKVGPSLDNLSEAADAAGMPLEEFIHESLVDPGAYVPPNYVAGAMPSFESLPADKLDELVQYLAENTT